MRNIFLPPGVQRSLWESTGHIPRQGTIAQADEIDRLWARRNTAPEIEIEEIDREMLRIMGGAK